MTLFSSHNLLEFIKIRNTRITRWPLKATRPKQQLTSKMNLVYYFNSTKKALVAVYFFDVKAALTSKKGNFVFYIRK